MSILIDADTRVIIQGITGRQGRFHAEKLLEYGVKLVGGITPGKSGQEVHGVPVFDTISQAGLAIDFDATMILVPVAGVLDAALEAIENRIPLIVVIPEFIPVHDTMIMREAAVEAGVRLIGPNTVGIISPGKSKVGMMPGFIYKPGHVGVISRSGTLTHEISSNLSYRDIGQSTCVCIGGDTCKGVDFVDILKLFRDDEETRSVIIIGEIGGANEEIAADYLRENSYPKKVIAYIAGCNVPDDKKMGHAGAIVSKGIGSAQSKIKSLKKAGVVVVDRMDEIFQHLT